MQTGAVSASISGGEITAALSGTLDLGGFGVPTPTLSAHLTGAPAGDSIHRLDGSMEAVVPASGDGSIDRCVDGDGRVVLGDDCATSGGFADGYEINIGLTGTRVLVVDPS